jgi:hypothetical protein
MAARLRLMLAAAVAAAAFLFIGVPGAPIDKAMAGGCGCGGGGGGSPPPPPPPPPSHPPGHWGGNNNNNINIIIDSSVVVGATSSSQATAIANANGVAAAYANGTATSSAGATGLGLANGAANANGTGGGLSSSYGGGYLAASPSGFLQGLNVDDGQARRTAYEATRTRVRKVIIQGVCIDDRAMPHPASQVTPDRDLDRTYDGEVYRCIAGTHMQVTIADYDGRIAFDHGRTLDCAKGEALYFSPSASAPGAEGQGGGQLVCRVQKPARDCNERSLLRRFGPGVKILTLIEIEKYTAYREETVRTTTTSTTTMSLDGGVGGVMY